jgi:ATP-binding cassette subfamily B protein
MIYFWKIYARVLGLLGTQKSLAWRLSIANVALACALFFEPILFGKIIDELSKIANQTEGRIWESISPLLLLWIGFGLFTIVSSTLIALYSDRLAHSRRHAVMNDYVMHVLHLPMSQLSRTHSGKLMKVMTQGTDALWSLWLSFFREQLAAFVSLVVLMPLAFFINWQLASILMVLCVFFVLLTHSILRKTQKLQQQIENHHTEMATQASDTLSNIALVQSFTRIDAEAKSLSQISQRVLQAQFPILNWWAVVTVMTRCATSISIFCIILLGVWLYSHSLVSVGEIVTFVAFAGLVITRLDQSVSFINRLATEAPRLKDFFDVLDTTPEVKDKPDAIDPGRLVGLIEFKNVSFSYNANISAVNNLSFCLHPGQTLALVGTSGAGKSTALSLLYRAFDRKSGLITIDGHDIEHIKLRALRQNIGVVFQEPFLFNRSIAENLRIGSPEASDEALHEAVSCAQALDFIMSQPDGFDTIIGEHGRTLSGGERQRLSLARVVLKNAPILILDEATSALDTPTETSLLKALEAVTQTRTTLVIAHRLSTIRNADVILVMENGKAVESGNFEELMAQNGVFAGMMQQQYGMPNKLNGSTFDQIDNEQLHK